MHFLLPTIQRGVKMKGFKFLENYSTVEFYKKKYIEKNSRGVLKAVKKFLSGVAWEPRWESDAKATLLSVSYERHFTFYYTDQRM